jgi:hypothetical protein
MNDRKDRVNHDDLARQVLRKAAGQIEPDVSRIVAAVPEIMAEARRRRARETQAAPLDALALLARRAIPRLAAAAAVLILAAGILGLRDTPATADTTTGVDGYLLTGELSQGVSDLLLEAMAEKENGNG